MAQMMFLEKLLCSPDRSAEIGATAGSAPTDISVTAGLAAQPTHRHHAPTECVHSAVNQNGQVICEKCGEILQSYFLLDQINFHTKIRLHKPVLTIEAELPSYLSRELKQLTVEIYSKVTENKIFRNIFRKAIIFASLHRASILLNQPMAFDDMLESFGLKTHHANKGISFVSNAVQHQPLYSIPFNVEELNIASILITLGLKGYIKEISLIFAKVKRNSNLLNVSHSKSVICGCVYFHIKYMNTPLSLKQFAAKCGMAAMTIQKKYIEIYKIILKSFMKDLFSALLCNSIASVCPSATNDAELDRLVLRDVETGRIQVRNIRTCITAKNTVADRDYPLDDVDDVLDWNVLLGLNYRTYVGGSEADQTTVPLEVVLIETGKDMLFNFNKYDTMVGGGGGVDGFALTATRKGEAILQDLLRMAVGY